jgi:thioredoxin-related protein
MSRAAAAVMISAMIFSSLFAEGVQWRSWEAGIKEAKVSNKIVMIDAVRRGCHYCEDMEAQVFKDAAMAAYIEKRFVPVKIDLSEEALPLDLDVSMTPTFFFISEEGRLIKRVPGSWNREDFRSFLDGVKKEEEKQ